MKDYIEREAALKAMSQAIQNRTWSMDDFDVMIKMEDNVKELPAADVEPVRHGKWIGRSGTGQYDDYYCSLCGMYEEGTRNRKLLGNYCSNCGAKMDGGNSNGTV